MLRLQDHTTDQFNLAMYSGVYAVFYYMQACYPYLKETKGSVINFLLLVQDCSEIMDSVHMQRQKKESVDFPEWQQQSGATDGINVNIVCPLAWTAQLENFQKAYPEAFKANVKMPPAGHYGDVEKEIGRVMRTACFSGF